MRDSKTILVAGDSSYAGGVLVRKLLKAGHKVKTPQAFIYRDDILLDGGDLSAIFNASLIGIEDNFSDIKKLKKIISGCSVVIYLAQASNNDSYKVDCNGFISLVDISQACGVNRFIYVLSRSEHSTLFAEQLKNRALDNFVVIVTDVSAVYANSLKQKLKIPVNILTEDRLSRHKLILYSGKQLKTTSHIGFSDKWYTGRDSNNLDFYIDNIADICLYLSEQPLKTIQKKIWPGLTTCRIFLNRFYIMGKLSQMLRKPYIPFIGRIKFSLRTVKRLLDVSFMMFFLHLWPEQTYRFSTRKCLPSKAARFRKNSKPIIPYELIESRTSYIPKMKEVNIVMRGVSFDIKRLQNLGSPIFLASFWDPIRTEKDVTYLTCRAQNALRFGKLGLKAIYVETNSKDYNGNISPDANDYNDLWYDQFIDNGICKRIAILEKVYLSSRPPSLVWAPTGSALPLICALSFFAERVNVYGWDFYLKSSPKDMNYWQLYFNLYKLKLDIFRSRNHLESAIVNFYYGYELSKLPNINIYGNLGQLAGQERLVGRLEKTLFNA